ncbi:MAG: pilus assembly protein TadG-related protein [Ilumatobacter sp.]|uniref:pilus assembly protein TadG-related protein n=1 Tax=Ilumatobacter sp. TaxID=1967498 RepID=UPI0032975C7F
MSCRRWRANRIEPVADERGGIAPFIVMLLPIFVGLAGLAHDGSQLFAARREAVNVAAAAARAGANDIDEPSIYAADPVLSDTALATATAFAYAEGAETAVASRIDPVRVQVTVTDTVDLTFLGFFGVGSQTVEGTADARLRQAVTAS